jgi:Ca2+-binding RTX toxin-like protein
MLPVDLEGPNASVVNAATGLMSGLIYGIDFVGTGSQSLSNLGQIIGSIAAGIHFEFGSFTMSNRGSILSLSVGLEVDQSGSGAISNFGLIRASSLGSVGIRVQSFLSSAVTNIMNGHTGIISGDYYAIEDVFGVMSLSNHGKIFGGIRDFANVSSVIINHGLIQGLTQLGGGNDQFRGTGGRSGPVFGDDGNDRLIGGSHRDQLHGGDGNDKLTGGLGADQFFFDTAVNGSVDKITDFTPSQHDKLVLSAAFFAGLTPVGGTLDASEFHVGSTATDPNQHILYTPSNGFLFYDQDGSGTTFAPVHFATLFSTPTTHPTIGHWAFLVEA